MIDAARLLELESLSLLSGSHDEIDHSFCVMEAVAYIANEPWSDHPACACPVITAFLMSWNDSLPNDAERDRLLKPLIPRIVGTRSTEAVEERRSYMALDWLVRVHTPAFLDMVPALRSHAADLRALDEIVDLAGATAAGKHTSAAWAAAGAAAGAAARAAAGDAAGDAARAAARDAAGDAARAAAGDAARAAAGDAAGAAARDAARAAAGDAARAEIKPPVAELQISALALVNRMIEVKS